MGSHLWMREADSIDHFCFGASFLRPKRERERARPHTQIHTRVIEDATGAAKYEQHTHTHCTLARRFLTVFHASDPQSANNPIPN